MTDPTIDIPLEYYPDKKTALKNKKPVIYGISIGKDTGHFIAATYSQIYAVFINSSPILLSIITSMRNLIQLAVQYPFGRLSDNFGRKPFLVVGLFIASLMSFILPTIADPIVFLCAMIIYSIAFSIFAPAWMSMLGDESSKTARGSYIGKITTISVIFTMIAFLITGWIVPIITEDYLQQYRIIYNLGGITFLFAGIAALFSKETNPNNNLIYPKESLKGFKFQKILDPLRENPTFRRFVLVSAFMDFSMSLGWPLFSFIRERYTTPSQYSLLWATHMAMQVFSLTIGGKVIDRYGKKWGFWGRRVMFLIPVVLYFATNWIELAVANFIGGIGYGLYFVTTNAYIIDSAPEKSKGKYVGVYQLVMGLATFAGSLAMGFVAEYFIAIFGKWSAIYSLVLVVALFRFIGGILHFTLEESKQTENPL